MYPRRRDRNAISSVCSVDATTAISSIVASNTHSRFVAEHRVDRSPMIGARKGSIWSICFSGSEEACCAHTVDHRVLDAIDGRTENNQLHAAMTRSARSASNAAAARWCPVSIMSR